MGAYTDAEVQICIDWLYSAMHDDRQVPEMAENLLEDLVPAIAARAKAAAWDEGYAVAQDDFVHSDYCGRKCQCEGIHGQKNPYRSTP